MDLPRWVQLACVAVFASALTLKVCAQLRRGIKPIVLGTPGHPARFWVEVVMVGSLFAWFGVVALDAQGKFPEWFAPRWPVPIACRILGTAGAVASLTLLVCAFVAMGRSWRIGIDMENPDPLVVTGVFSVSRNPIFAAMGGFAVSVLLISGSWFFATSAPILLLGVHLQVLREEAELKERFGEPYARYMRSTRRYLGRSAGESTP